MNLFRQAKQLLDTKKGAEMTDEELNLVATAIIPLMIKTNGFFGDITIGEGLEELAKIVEAKDFSLNHEDKGGFMKIFSSLFSKSDRKHRWASRHLSLVRILKEAKMDYYEFFGKKGKLRKHNEKEGVV